MKLPQLKGHVKIYTKDKNGRITKHFEGENVVTNAVRDILANDYLGALDPNLMTPLWKKWYGGVMLYQNAHDNLDPDDYWMRDSAGNINVGHAGHDNEFDRTIFTIRGMYDTSQEVRAKNSIKQVWNFSQDCGSMSFQSLSLCNESLGNVGLNSNEMTAGGCKNFLPFEILSNRIPNFIGGCNAANNLFFMIDATHGGWFTIGEPGEYYNMHSRFETTKITIYSKKLAILKVGLTTTQDVEPEYDDLFTIDLGDSLWVQPAFMYENGILWLFSNITGTEGTASGDNLTYDQTTMRYWKIDIANKQLIDSGSWPYFTGLGPCAIEGKGWYDGYAPMYMGTRSMNPCLPHMTFFGNNLVFFPKCDNPASAGIAPAFHVTDLMSISLTSGYPHASVWYRESQYELPCFMGAPFGAIGNSHPIATPGRIINATVAYECMQDPFWVDNRHVVISGATQYNFLTPTKPSSYVIPVGTGDSCTLLRSFVANKFLDTTKLNLPETFVKDADETLTIEYTLTEV